MIEPPSDHNATAFADWLEATLLFSKIGRLSFSEIEGAFDKVQVDDIEAQISNLNREIDRRAKYTGGYYPLKSERRAFSIKKGWKASLVYSFLLLVSLNQHYSKLRFSGRAAKKPSELFEFLTHYAIKRYMGGISKRVGAFRKSPVPRSFWEAVKYISDLTNERLGGGTLDTSKAKDDGLDVIAWCPFNDQRPGQLIILGQCTIEKYWRRSFGKLNVDIWSDHIRWAVKPIRAFAVPFVHEDEKAWRRTSLHGGLILDRARITSLIRPADLPKRLVNEIREWCLTRIKSLPKWT